MEETTNTTTANLNEEAILVSAKTKQRFETFKNVLNNMQNIAWDKDKIIIDNDTVIETLIQAVLEKHNVAE